MTRLPHVLASWLATAWVVELLIYHVWDYLSFGNCYTRSTTTAVHHGARTKPGAARISANHGRLLHSHDEF